jgi:uncharacterized surface protein with fasciclin (FAS1) repeats
MRLPRSMAVGLATLVVVAALVASSVRVEAAHAATATEAATITQVVAAADNLKTLAALLQATGLDKTLATSGQKYTIFAPTDAAFAALPAATLAGLASDPEALKSVLMYHAVAGEISSDAAKSTTSLMTLDGARVGMSVVGDSLYVNNAKVVAGGTAADNGVVYAIDTVLMPPDPAALGSSRVGYCAVAGNTYPSGTPVKPGQFLNLQAGQPDADYHYAGAVPAAYAEGIGLTCVTPSTGYKQEGMAPANLHVPANTYPYWAKTG